MSHHGATFQFFRKNKNLSLVKAAGNIVTPQFLGRFEKGESDITFSSLEKLLNRMHVSMEEFIHKSTSFSNYMSVEDMVAKLDNIAVYKDKALLDNSLKQIADLDENQSLFFEHLIIILKRYDNVLFGANHKLDVNLIFNYLEQTETWGKYEFFIATYAAPALSNEQLSLCVYHASSKTIFNSVIYDLGVDFILHCFIFLLLRDEIDLTKKLILFFKSHQNFNFTLQYLYFHLFLNFIEACILIMENDLIGLKKSQDIIDFFEQNVDYEEYAQHLKKILFKLTGY